MVLDINLFREDKGGNPEAIRESQRRRFAPVQLVDDVIGLDKLWREKLHEVESFNKELNQLSNAIREAKKKGEASADVLEEKKKEVAERTKDVKKQQAESEAKAAELKLSLDHTLTLIGNIVHQSVPVSKDEANNEIVATWGTPNMDKNNLWYHHRILSMIGGYDPERGVEVTGHRGYFLKGKGVELNLALINYATQFLVAREYTLLQTPYFMRKDVMAECAQLSQFDEELYKVQGTDESYLIATSEQPISAFHRGEWLEPSSLPLRYGGFSTCFRKEAGAHGKDTWGIFRVHQFDKVEQFVITAPENSWQEQERMLEISKEFFQSLGIPYRVVTIVSGELNNAAAKKYDLEGWFPAYGEYRELVSCSNCTDYQARRLGVRYGSKKTGEREKKFVHMLNSTLCACTRAICAILENFQTENGVTIPEPLRPFMGGKDLIPFIQKPKKDWKKGGPLLS